MLSKTLTATLIAITGLLMPLTVSASPAEPELLDTRGRTNGQCRFDDGGKCGGRGFCHLVTGEAVCCGKMNHYHCSGNNNHCEAGGARIVVNCD
ncbi:uncharacterized protein GGS22DRAFT_185532 [Annulohypoxylon maeteangense]|uniref:uncharacterized protein n=1 Tax=Annulohypoxylon maeteangense TaxID=1927788 RepID=UPI002007D0D1|nr:uncharacterized protein GGS22DRAFT_185532 [Annulohypoxylon maeteangense]KAI0888152.1 hypothetical protein GGS22DRAFT_185532 [Annulohypoxylon maeteangense]